MKYLILQHVRGKLTLAPGLARLLEDLVELLLEIRRLLLHVVVVDRDQLERAERRVARGRLEGKADGRDAQAASPRLRRQPGLVGEGEDREGAVERHRHPEPELDERHRDHDAREAERALLRALDLKKSDPVAAVAAAEEALKLAGDALEGFSPKVEASLEVSSPRPGAWQEATVVVRNDGKALAKGVTVQVLGDLEVEPLQELGVLRAQGVERIATRIRFPRAGRVPIILKVNATRVLDGKAYEAEKIQEVEVVTPGPSGPRRIIADFDTRCLVCRGTIKKGFAAAKCTCNSLFHEMCAKRSGKCPVCSTSLTQIQG